MSPRIYSEEFKRNAVARVLGGQLINDVAAQLDMPRGTLWGWVKAAGIDTPAEPPKSMDVAMPIDATTPTPVTSTNVPTIPTSAIGPATSPTDPTIPTSATGPFEPTIPANAIDTIGPMKTAISTPEGFVPQAVHQAALDRIAKLVQENKMLGEAARYFARQWEPR